MDDRPETLTSAVDGPGPAASDGPLDFECPRCATAVSEEYYGPCGTCRGDLRASVVGAARDVANPEYVPKMNVTPNAVALKD